MLNMLDFITSRMDKKQFPFEEGDDYWVVVGDKVLGSVWDIIKIANSDGGV